jgi:hypothetical protein
LNFFYTRFFHASDVVGRKIVVHGGWDETSTYGDIWIFNTDSFTWMQPKTSGTAHDAFFCCDRAPNAALEVVSAVLAVADTSLTCTTQSVKMMTNQSLIRNPPSLSASLFRFYTDPKIWSHNNIDARWKIACVRRVLYTQRLDRTS